MYSIGITETLDVIFNKLGVQSSFLNSVFLRMFTFLTAIGMCLPALNCFALTKITTHIKIFTLLNQFLNPYLAIIRVLLLLLRYYLK